MDPLIERGAVVDEVDDYGRSPLWISSQMNCQEVSDEGDRCADDNSWWRLS